MLHRLGGPGDRQASLAPYVLLDRHFTGQSVTQRPANREFSVVGIILEGDLAASVARRLSVGVGEGRSQARAAHLELGLLSMPGHVGDPGDQARDPTDDQQELQETRAISDRPHGVRDSSSGCSLRWVHGADQGPWSVRHPLRTRLTHFGDNEVTYTARPPRTRGGPLQSASCRFHVVPCPGRTRRSAKPGTQMLVHARAHQR